MRESLSVIIGPFHPHRSSYWFLHPILGHLTFLLFPGTYLKTFFGMRPSVLFKCSNVYRWATDWTIGILGFDSRRGLGIFLFSTASRTALGPTQPPIQWVPWVLFLGVKRPGREADHSPPSSAEVKMCGCMPPLPQYAFMAWCLVKHRDNFIFTNELLL
jgi:hypothetical protein